MYAILRAWCLCNKNNIPCVWLIGMCGYLLLWFIIIYNNYVILWSLYKDWLQLYTILIHMNWEVNVIVDSHCLTMYGIWK